MSRSQGISQPCALELATLPSSRERTVANDQDSPFSSYSWSSRSRVCSSRSPAKGSPPLSRVTLAHRQFALPARRSSDRKSTRLNSSHLVISYAVFCLQNK